MRHNDSTDCCYCNLLSVAATSSHEYRFQPSFLLVEHSASDLWFVIYSTPTTSLQAARLHRLAVANTVLPASIPIMPYPDLLSKSNIVQILCPCLSECQSATSHHPPSSISTSHPQHSLLIVIPFFAKSPTLPILPHSPSTLIHLPKTAKLHSSIPRIKPLSDAISKILYPLYVLYLYSTLLPQNPNQQQLIKAKLKPSPSCDFTSTSPSSQLLRNAAFSTAHSLTHSLTRNTFYGAVLVSPYQTDQPTHPTTHHPATSNQPKIQNPTPTPTPKSKYQAPTPIQAPL